MRTAHCDGCWTAAEAASLDVLQASGWSTVEHTPDEHLLLLCPTCQWQRTQAVELVSEAVVAAFAARAPRADSGRTAGRRMGWFWS